MHTDKTEHLRFRYKEQVFKCFMYLLELGHWFM